MLVRCPRALAALAALVSLTPLAPGQTWENCTPLQTHVGAQPGALFGWIGVRAGDVDGDLVEDYLITATQQGAAKGRVQVFSGATGAQIWSVTGSTGETLGFSGGAAGELNGDAFGEFAAGAPGTGAGAGYVWSGADKSVHFSAVGEAAGDAFGTAYASVGDLDGDGVNDVAFGAPGNDAAGTNAGRVYVHSGASGARIRTFDGPAAGESFGGALAGVGDRDGDTVPDLLVGALGASGGKGAAYVISGVDGAPIWTLSGDSSSVNFSQFFLGPCGDLDNDGTEDLFVSDFNNKALGSGPGRAFLFDGTDGSLMYKLTGEGAGDGFGIGRGWAGDIDGDGHDDLVFGHWTNSAGASSAGRVSIFRGVDGSKLFSWTSDVAGTTLGYDAAGIADLDGDGFTDFLLTGAQQNGSAGVAYLMSSKDPQPPTAYCQTTPNSVGAGALMDYRKSASVAANEFRVRVGSAPVNVPGVFFYGFGQTANPWNAGTMCVSTPRYRLGPPVMTGNSGGASRTLDFTAPPLAGPGPVMAGTTAYFQFMYRDTAGPAGAQVTLSDALEVTFCP